MSLILVPCYTINLKVVTIFSIVSKRLDFFSGIFPIYIMTMIILEVKVAWKFAVQKLRLAAPI